MSPIFIVIIYYLFRDKDVENAPRIPHFGVQVMRCGTCLLHSVQKSEIMRPTGKCPDQDKVRKNKRENEAL